MSENPKKVIIPKNLIILIIGVSAIRNWNKNFITFLINKEIKNTIVDGAWEAETIFKPGPKFIVEEKRIENEIKRLKEL